VVAGGTLSVVDPDTGEAIFQAPATLTGTYGDFAFDPVSGVWSYVLDHAKADSLTEGQVMHDTLTASPG
jgi:VCBS repeat-containing protein